MKRTSLPLLRRRAFFTLLGGAAAAWPLAARAQQGAMPVVGFVHSGDPDTYARAMNAFHRGLNEGGFVEGRNVLFDYRWTGTDLGLFPALAADLVRRRVNVIAGLSRYRETENLCSLKVYNQLEWSIALQAGPQASRL
jgi:putative ABC transport system substrate-binding protein